MIQFGSLPVTNFLNDYTTARVKVNGKVISANFSVESYDGQSLPVYFHKPPEINYPVDGYVECAFDPSLTVKTPGEYKLIFRVEYLAPNGETKIDTLIQKVDFRPQSIIQWYISELRVALGDDMSINKFLPQRFYIRPKDVNLWEDEELKRFLDIALQDINNASPPTLRFTYNDPYLPVNFLIYGAMVRALMAAGLIEVYNWYETNAPIRVVLYKGDKLKDFANWVQSMYLDPLKEWKRHFAYYTARPKVMVLTKMPFRVIRPLNMLFGYHNFFTG